MKDFINLLISVIILPPLFLLALTYPDIRKEVDARLPLLSVYYISQQLHQELNRYKPNDESTLGGYASILANYGYLVDHPQLKQLTELSRSSADISLSEKLIGQLVLWTKGLPTALMQADPIRDINVTISSVRKEEKILRIKLNKYLQVETLRYLQYLPPESVGTSIYLRNGLPPTIRNRGFTFCGESVPLNRSDIKLRIVHQIEYLTSDFSSTTALWLKRRDRYGPLVGSILKREGVPREFALLPALESNYNRSALSPLLARGWWQFIKPTAIKAVSSHPSLDWTLRVDKWHDERCDLALSTRAAAKYLKWIRLALKRGSQQASWLTVAAAYNGGITQVGKRATAYGSTEFWDIKLPLETEEYVPRWIAFAIIDSHRDYYGFDIPSLKSLQFDSLKNVRLIQDLPLSVLAVLTESSIRLIREINGSLPDDRHAIRAPRNKTERLPTIHVPKGWGKTVMAALKATNYIEDKGSLLGRRRPTRNYQPKNSSLGGAHYTPSNSNHQTR